jgi:hypothetical protein
VLLPEALPHWRKQPRRSILASRGTIDRSVHRIFLSLRSNRRRATLLCRFSAPAGCGPARARPRRNRSKQFHRQKLPLCAALFVEEVSPIIHHRLKTYGQGTSNCGLTRWIRTTTAHLARAASPGEASAIFTTDRMFLSLRSKPLDSYAWPDVSCSCYRRSAGKSASPPC